MEQLRMEFSPKTGQTSWEEIALPKKCSSKQIVWLIVLIYMSCKAGGEI